MSIEHPGHCGPCKEQVRRLLGSFYGDCRSNHSFPWSAQVKDYEDTFLGETLKRIHAAIGDLRGNRNFAKSALLPPCDYFVPSPPCIIEFDESQHFSRPRMVSLALYPFGFSPGFLLSRWRELCLEINSVDDDPPDRDERRAWYDALRDLVPSMHGFRPTVRLYAGEFTWCSLDERSPEDRQRFSLLLKDRCPTF